MERYDPEKAARVWQRVQGEGQATLSGLAGLAAAEQSTAELFRQLHRQNPKATTEQMAAECMMNAAALWGMGKLLGQQISSVPTQPMQRQLAENLLHRCYSATLQALNAYERSADHPEYGPAFRELARRKQQHCCRILELLGNSPTPKGQK